MRPPRTNRIAVGPAACPGGALQAAPTPTRRASPGSLVWLLVLVGCAGAPPHDPVDAGRARIGSARPDRDGPEANPPPNLAAVPDAEPVRVGGPNKPYAIAGETYVPLTRDEPFVQRGLASWYGRKFHGARTASGERYDMYAMTAAHPTLPIPSYVRIRNPANGREIVVRINDRGPFHSTRIVDLSYTAALKLDLLRGVAPVELRRITGEEIRAAAGNRTDPSAASTAGGPAREASTTDVARPPLSTFAATTPVRATPPTAGADPATSTTTTTVIPMPMPTPTTSAERAEAWLASAEAGEATAPSLEPAGNAPATTAPSRAAPAVRRVGQPEHEEEAAMAASSTHGSDATPGNYWIQLGAFRAREGALALEARIAGDQDWLAPLLAIFDDAPFFRLQAGPYPDRDAATRVVERLRRGPRLDALVVVRP